MSLIFISHSSQDNDVAAKLRDRLFEQGYSSEGSIFLDFDGGNGINAGQDWEQALYRNVRACRAVIVLCSQASLASRWCFMEITHARAMGKHLFPVKIDDCKLEGLLSDHQVVDLTIDVEEGYRRLFRGISEVGLDPGNIFFWDRLRPPYPGLMAFQEADVGVFFGREEETAEVMDLLNRSRRLRDTGLVMVLGASGSGKSSVVRAGLIPRLRKDVERWLVVDPFRPLNDPVSGLAEVLARAFDRYGIDKSAESLINIIRKASELFSQPEAAESSIEQSRPDAKRHLLDALSVLERSVPESSKLETVRRHLRLVRHDLEHSASLGEEPSQISDCSNLLLDTLVSLRRANRRDGATILLIVDQFEELLDRPPDHPAHCFLRLLRHCVDSPSPPLLVVGTMRSDFVGSFQKCPALAGLHFETIPLRSMSRLAPVIIAPAEAAGIELESGLAEALVADATTDDALPLLAFALREMYDRAGERNKQITLRDYDDLGRLEGAVAQSAGQLVSSLTGEQLGWLRNAMLRLARITDEGSFARRVVPWSDLDSRAHPILQEFIEGRLLVADERDGERVLEVAHEALFRSWDMLRGWLDESIEELRLTRELERSATEWEKGRRSGEYLWRGGRLARAIEFRKADGLTVGPLETEFLNSSQEAEQTEKRTADARRRRQLRRTRLAVAVVSALLINSTVLYYRATKQHQIAVAKQLASDSGLLRSTSVDWTVPALLAVESARLAQTIEGYEELWQAYDIMAREVLRLSNRAAEDRNSPFEDGAALAISPDGILVASGSNDNTARVFDLRSGKEQAKLSLEGRLRALAFSPDAMLLAAGSERMARVFDLRGNRELTLVAHDGPVTAVTFSHDGELVATGCKDGNARVFVARTGEEVARFPLASIVWSVAFSPNGKYLAIGSGDFTARVFDIRSRAELLKVQYDRMMIAYEAGVNSVAFSPDGKLLASGSENDTARIINVETGALVAALAHRGPVASVAFSPDGAWVATASSDTFARVFFAQTGREMARLAFQGKVRSAVFSPDGTMVAAGSEDRSARVFQARSGREVMRLAVPEPVFGVAFSPDGSRVAVAARRTSTRVFEARPSAVTGKFKSDSTTQGQLVYNEHESSSTVSSPNGSVLAVWFMNDREVRVVDARSRRLIALLKVDGMVSSAAFSPDGDVIAVGSVEGQARVFDARSGRVIQQVKLAKMITGLVFSPDGRLLALASMDRTVCLLNARSGGELARYGHQDSVAAIAFSPDGKLLAAASGSTVHVREVGSGAVVARLALRERVYRVEFSLDGRFLRSNLETYFPDTETTLAHQRVDPFLPADLIAAVCTKLDRNLTREEFPVDIPYREVCSTLNRAVVRGRTK